MRTPSFVSQSRAPAAFGVAPAGYAPAGQARIRPAGDAIDQDPSCATSTYHNIQFYDISHTCMNTTHDLSNVQLYNVFGYPIDRYGSPMTGGSVPPAPWAQVGTQNEAWYEPNSSMMLDQNGDPIGQAQFNPYAKGGMQATTPTTPIRPGVTPVPALQNLQQNPMAISQNTMIVGGIIVAGIIGFLLIAGNQKPVATEPMSRPPPGLARARSPRRSARRNPKSASRGKKQPKLLPFEADYDEETGLWCVFREGGTHAYASYSSKEEAEEAVARRNLDRAL